MKAFQIPIFKTDKRNSFCLTDSKCNSLGLCSGDVVFYKLIKKQNKLKDGIYLYKYHGFIYCRYLSFNNFTNFVSVYSFETKAPELLFSLSITKIEIIGEAFFVLKHGGKL